MIKTLRINNENEIINDVISTRNYYYCFCSILVGGREEAELGNSASKRKGNEMIE